MNDGVYVEGIVIFQAEGATAQIEVRVDSDTIWLTQKQMAELFEKDSDTVGLHIRNIYKSGELQREATTEKNSVVQKEGDRKVRRVVQLFNLDMVLSVGYRVNSKRGTQFRIWASNILKQYLLQGYSVNEQLLSKQQEKLVALTSAIKLLGRTAEKQVESLQEAAGLIKVLTDYAYALDVLDSYDHDCVVLEGVTKGRAYILEYPEAIAIIELMRDDFGGLFGVEKDQSFKGSLAAIYQSFGENDLYPSIEEKAAHLLYFVVKNHSFSDGNKRIAAAIFLHFLRRNNLLYEINGEKSMADSTLIAITLMIAESRPQEKDIIVKIVANLIARAA